MKRNGIKWLIDWKNSQNKQPFLLTGMKGIGKTYLALDFAKSFYEGFLYVNFETCADIGNAFEKNNTDSLQVDFGDIIFDFYQIPKELSLNILLILDELQNSSAAYISFLQWIDKADNPKVLLITSENTSFSEHLCKSFERHQLYPMDFDEFLMANGSEWYMEIIKAHALNNRKIPDIVHRELLSLFEDYLQVGGFPAAVNEYLSFESSDNVQEIHQSLMNNIRMANILKYSESEALKMNQIMDTMESQLLKANKKFQYRFIRKGATYAMYKTAISDLRANGHIIPCCKITEPDSEAHMVLDETSFQLYYSDCGVLSSILKKSREALKLSDEQKKKLVLENYVIQSLNAKGYLTGFWESGSQAKIDILSQHADGLIPFDVRVNENSRSKSITVFRNTYKIPYSIKLSPKNFELVNDIKNMPYYSLFTF